MTDISPNGDQRSSAAIVLERIQDPVLGVEDGMITHANATAREVFDLPSIIDDRSASAVLGPLWAAIEPSIGETTIGTVRLVHLEDERFDARIHAATDGITITFEPADTTIPAESEGDVLVWDHEVKDRAINEAPVGITISDPSGTDNPLVYVNDAFERLTGYPLEEIVGENCRFLQGSDSDPEAVAAMRAAIDAEEPVTVELVNYRHDGTPFWNEVTIAPVHDRSGRLMHFVGFQNDITARKEAEFEAERRAAEVRAERAKLERILEHIEGLIQDVTAIVTRATSRSVLETEICDRITADELFDGACIGERNLVSGTIEVRASSGVHPEDVPVDAEHPAIDADENQSSAVGSVDGAAIAACPLSYGESVYGVLTVYGSDETVFTEDERVVLSGLARAVASGINAREAGVIIATDAVVSVEVESSDERLAPAVLSSLADCRLEYRGSTHEQFDTTASLFIAVGASAADLEAAASDLEWIDVEPIVEWDGGCLIQLAVDGIVEWLSNRGAATRKIRAADGVARITIEIPRSTNVRPFVDAIQGQYPDTEVVSVRQYDRSEPTREEFVDLLEETLTERQITTLQRAYLTGYFEWPRPVTGEDLARSMGVSRPTFHQHLRNAMRKVCQTMFDRNESLEFDR